MKKIIFIALAMLKKKLILVGGFHNQGEKSFMENVDGKISAAVAYPQTPPLDPAPATTQAKVIAVKAKIVTRKIKEVELMQLNKEIAADKKEIEDTVVDIYMPATQIFIAGDETLAKKYSYDWRGEHPKVAPVVSGTNSRPVLQDVGIVGGMTHEIYQLNSVTQDWKLPDDVKECRLYQTFDVANVHNLKKMNFLGVFKKSKFVNHFDEEDLGKDVYYVAVYVLKAGVDGESELSTRVQSHVV